MADIIRINAKQFINVNTTFGIITILICYICAQILKHVDSILPMISDCFVYEPENYISRFGVISFINCGNLVSNILIAKFVATSYFIKNMLYFIALFNSVCFGFVGAISELDNLYIHNVFALSGYISYAVFLSIIKFTSIESHNNIMSFPYIIVLFLKFINSYIKLKPLIEWLLTLIYSFNMYMFASFMKSEYIIVNSII